MTLPTPHVPPKDVIQVGPIAVRFLLDGDDTDGRYCLFEFLVPPGTQVPAPHFHESVDEIAYGLDGVLTYHVNGQDYPLASGDRVFVPRGIIHGFQNLGTVTARALNITSPAAIGPRYFREMAALHAASDPPDLVQVADIMRRHGLLVAAHPAP